MIDLTYMKNFIKFLTITFYHKLDTKKDYFKHLTIDYLLSDDSTDYIDYEHNESIASITIEYDKSDLNLLSLSTFVKDKNKVFNKTNHIYLLSLKNEELIPYNKYKVKECSSNSLLSLQSDTDIIYYIKLDDICLLINNYFNSIKKYLIDKKIDAFEVFQLLDNLFLIADHYFESFKDIHLTINFVFFKNFKYSKKHRNSEHSIYLDLNDEIQSFIKLINKSPTKTITVTSYGRAFELYFKIKHKKSFIDILEELNMFYDFTRKEGDYAFKKIKKFNLQDFIIYLTILTNLLSI